MSEQDKVLDRVRKMLRLANDAAASEGERDNALRMAHATLAKHNLSLSSAMAGGATAPEEARIEGRMEGKDYPWMRTVAAAIAKLFFCEYMYVLLRGGKVVHYFVGRASNTITAQEMSRFVIDSIDREGRKYSRDSYTGGTGWRSFCKGAAHRVYSRCEQIRADAVKPPEQQPTTGTALVLASVYATEESANKALIESQYGKLKSSANRQRNTSWGAFDAGTAYGDRVSLNNQIGSTPGARKALK